MSEQIKKSPYMDYRNTVPFIDLSGYVVKQPTFWDETPVKSLQEYLRSRKFSLMINLRRLQYRKSVEEYKNGRK